ncbi:MAG: aminomethyl-transferring glycine dehydrogenase [Pseudomonadales bacterium]|nr:aminomethyl-transferring glycine dehydrogenase [Pseudomonadales bacterium]MBP9033562.1 aminomethyl-transferring glycine dehydrogenase [Pseudomonadales bacterium]
MTSQASPAACPDLGTLEQRDAFLHRHIGPSEAQIAEMLATVGADSLDHLTAQTVPAAILESTPLALPGPQPEHAVLERLAAIAAKNRVLRSLIGCGYHDTITPAVILRNVLENPGWYTAYTPYQPEISQGRLEGLLNFQQMIIDLSGLELANASLLDEGTAAAEAMTLCKRVVRKNRSNTFFVAADCHPQTIAVVRTRAEPLGLEVMVGDPDTDLAGADVFGALFQYPGTDGRVRDLTGLIAQVHAKGALAVVAADLMSLLLLKSPGEMGADVALGNTQRFGVPMGFGGPHAAYFATRDEHKRSMPGRIIGVSIDARGNQALRMAMQTREQHIRREKATSNICTSQALLALMAAFYAVYHGPGRLRTIATRIHRLATILARGLEAGGFTLSHPHFFDTLAIEAGGEQAAIVQRALHAGINLRTLDGGRIGVSLDERSTRAEVETLWRIFCGDKAPAFDAIEATSALSVPAELVRRSAYLTHPIFNTCHSETEMLRYLRKLESRDIALNRAMIPLGSCTMKLNATTEMIPVTWPAFANMHPFAPREQAAGYAELMKELGDALIACTGYDVLSFQPNSGAQGEYAGLLAIRHYHRSRNEAHRDICLIPSSAHGTNPASAALAGMRVVIVECDAQGNVDIEDLRLKAGRHSEELAALMVTYPSTHGVFEQNIVEICALVHEHGGQVYLDGANMNALVGIARPGKFGADVSHLNLHKTFCIPHGGGGPGMGPIGVRAHLAPFLPGHVCTPIEGVHDDGMSVSAAPFGSASILPISWVYATLMGAAGLRKATQVAILSANYIAARLAPYYQVLYTGANGRVAHECIIDLRPVKERSGISEEDIAKRLVDYGFHAPTMSFPVPGTLMVEPTESEPKREIDRFCDAMISIHREVMAVESGQADATDNVLKNAPHTLRDITDAEWKHPYSRSDAAFPATTLHEDKYWAPVNRIDNVYGDRHLFCSCPSVESYRQPG